MYFHDRECIVGAAPSIKTNLINKDSTRITTAALIKHYHTTTTRPDEINKLIKNMVLNKSMYT